MKRKFDKAEIDLLISTLNTLNTTDKKLMQGIIAKIQTINKSNKLSSKRASASIMEMRKEDKLYARGNTVIQNHFNALAKKISKYIESRYTDEAVRLYEIMLDEAKLPKYEEQFNIAITTYLDEAQVNFLNRHLE